jgi:hypothetical protein
MGEHTLVGSLSGISIQSGIVTASKGATMYRHFGEAAVPERECGPCPVFASIYTLAFALQLRKNHGKTSVGAAEKCLTAVLGTIRLVDLVAVLRATTAGLVAVTTFASGYLGQPSVRYLPSCQTKGFPAPANLESKISGIWCDRQRTEHPSPREFAYNLCTKVHQ